MRHWKPVAVVLAALLLGASTPARAKDLLDYVIEAVDPTLAPARPLIECLAGGGAAEQCAVEAAKKQAAGALPIGPGDDRVQKAAKVFAAARDERWLDVLKIGGEVVAKSVSCAVLPVQGPLKGTACGIVGWVISKNAGALDKAYQALKGPDWWALVELLGPGVCEMVPGDGPAGLARDVLCGPLADKAKKIGNAGMLGMGPLFGSMAAGCFKDVKAQDPQPSVWALACADMRPRYGQVFAGETLRLAKAIGDLKKEGCELAIGGKGGPRLSCDTYAAYSDCLGKFHPNGKKYCSTPPVQLLDIRATQAAGPAATDAPLAGPVAGAAPPAGQARGRLDTGAIATTAGRLRQNVVSVEAETLLASGRVRLRGGRVVAQPMGGFGPGWSGDAQLFWHDGAPGAALDLLVDVPRDGAWVVEVDLTRAPDYGQLAFAVDQHRVAEGFDGYAPGVAGPATVSLGTFAMQRGERPVSLMITGRGRSSTGFLVGVDRIRLRPSQN